MSFRDTPTACEDETQAHRYEQKIFSLERKGQAGYYIKVQWECDFELTENMEDDDKEHALETRNALYVGQTEALLLHFRVKAVKKQYNTWTL